MALSSLFLFSMLAFVSGYTEIVDPLKTDFELTNKTCHTTTIHINPVEKYQTTHFTVWHCPIEEVPASLNSLKLLTVIRLNYNAIKFIDMSSFSNLDHLTDLHLQHNQIKTVSSSSRVNLPQIRYISFFSNQIAELDICQWNMPKLSQLYFNMNKLSYVTNFLNQFPSLDLTGLDGNSFNCEWQRQVLSEIGNTRIKIYPGYEISPCNPNDLSPPPSSCPPSSAIEDELYGSMEQPKDELEITSCSTKLIAMEAALEQLSQKLKKVEQAHRAQSDDYETKIKQLNEKLIWEQKINA